MTKFLKSIISVVLILSVFVIPTVMFAGHAEGVVELSASDINGRSLTASPITKNYNDIIDKQQNIYNCLTNFSNIAFGIDKGVNLDYATQLYSDVINDFDQFFYVATSFGYSEYFGKITQIRPCYVVAKSNIDSARQTFNEGMAKARALVDDSMNDLQKAMVLHDYVINNSVYADDEFDISHSAWGFFYNGRIVCAGLALVYSYFLRQVGVECDYIFSNQMHHAWNAVKVDGTWYYVDLTYDGQTLNNDYPNPNGQVLHRWFMKSEDYFYGEKGLAHKENMSFDYPNDGSNNRRPNGNKYDDYFWDNIGTNILVIDGNFYYLEPNYTAGYSKLAKRDKNGNRSYVTSGSFYSDHSTIYMAGGGYTVANDYMYGLLTYLEGKLVISTNNAVQMMNINGTGYPQTIDYTNNRSSAKTISLYIDDKQRVCYQLLYSNTIKSFNKLDYYKNYISTRSNGYNLFYYCDVDNNGYINAKDLLLIRKQMK